MATIPPTIPALIRTPASDHSQPGSQGMPVVAITRAVPTESGRAPTISGARVKMAPALPQMSRADLLAYVAGARAIVTMFHDKVDAEFLNAAGPGLAAVCNFAVGVDNIDLDLCKSRGVMVSNTPDAVTEGTANLAIALLLATSRRLCEGDRFVRAGRFEKEGNIFPTGWLGIDLTGKTLLIIGAGRIGRATAMRAQALGMRIIYNARTDHPEFEQAPLAARRVELDDGLREADAVSIHTPLTPATRHLIDARRLALMKPAAILVNTARGPIVDEAALAAALKADRLWGAGLDVFEREPVVHPDLLGLDNVTMTPHIGSAERRWRWKMTEMAVASAAAAIRGDTMPNRIA